MLIVVCISDGDCYSIIQEVFLKKSKDSKDLENSRLNVSFDLKQVRVVGEHEATRLREQIEHASNGKYCLGTSKHPKKLIVGLGKRCVVRTIQNSTKSRRPP